MTFFIIGLIAALLVGVALFTSFTRKAGRIGEKESNLSKKSFSAIVLHTYCPKHSRVPARGRIVSEAAVRFASQWKIPLILAVGHTVPGEPRTESQVYHDYLRERFPEKTFNIILGKDLDARDTARETKEAARLAKEQKMGSLLVVGLTPHLVRIQGYWQDFSKDFSLSYIGVSGPKRYYVWEFCMFILEKILPPGSRRRQIALNISGRRR